MLQENLKQETLLSETNRELGEKDHNVTRESKLLSFKYDYDSFYKQITLLSALWDVRR